MTDPASHPIPKEERKNKRRSQKIENPADLFSLWAYRIERHHYKFLGVEYRDFTVKKKATRSWAVWTPIVADIPEGTIFYLRDDPDFYLQVLADWDAFRAEVHVGDARREHRRTAWAVKHTSLASWLHSGTQPIDALSIDQSQSKAGLMAWRISRETPPNDN